MAKNKLTEGVSMSMTIAHYRFDDQVGCYTSVKSALCLFFLIFMRIKCEWKKTTCEVHLSGPRVGTLYLN